MVRAKAKVGPEMKAAAGSAIVRKNVLPPRFKVFSEREKPKIGSAAESSRKSLSANKDVAQTEPALGPKNTAKIKVFRDSSVTTNVRRKALVDVSNVRIVGSSAVVCDGSKPMTYKSGKLTNVNRGSMDLKVRTTSALPRKSTMAQAQGRPSQGTGKPCLSTRGMELATTSGTQMSKVKESGSNVADIDNRRAQINSLPLSRKSLPVLMRNNQENSESSDKGKGKTAIPIKAKSGTKVLPRLSNAGSLIAKSRPSHGNTMKLSKGQSSIRTYTSSAKPTTSSQNNVPVTSNVKTNTKTKVTQVADRSSSDYAVSSRNDIPEAKPLCNDTAPTVSQDNKGQGSSSGDLSLQETKVIIKRKGGRRRSYTSLLMTRSKILGENSEDVMEQVPNIDDGSNQLEVAEYVDDIYSYYWIVEAHLSTLANYMSIQGDVTPSMRGILINWLIEVHLKFDLMHETLYLMITLLDRYLSQVPIQKKEMQLVGLAALLLASKYEDFWHPRIKDLISISAEDYTREQMLQMESRILKQLKFRLNIPTPYVFMLRFLKAAQSDKQLEHMAFYLVELCLVEYKALEFRSSLLCASAIYVARLTLQISPTWTPLLVKHARYEVSHMRECAEMILRFQKAAGRGQLKVTYEKYAKSEFNRVAMIRPLNKLPA